MCAKDEATEGEEKDDDDDDRKRLISLQNFHDNSNVIRRLRINYSH
jgi:hypothetical protein